MLYRDDWDQVTAKYDEFWARENHDRPVLVLTAPNGRPGRGYLPYENLEDQWFNAEKIIHNGRNYLETTHFFAESIPALIPNLGPDIVAAFFGVDLTLGRDTTWASHPARNAEFDAILPLRLNRDGVWYKRMRAIVEAMISDAHGDYLVGMPDLHPGADALCAFRSSEQLCIDSIESPELIKKASLDIWREVKTAYDDFFALTDKNQVGSVHWMTAYHPGHWYTTSCDFICMISGKMFDEFIIDELKEELSYLDTSIFHLDGPDAIRHIDKLLALDNLAGIQWVPGQKEKRHSQWMPLLKKIQAAGKCLHLSGDAEDLPLLLDELSPEGLLYATSVQSEGDAEALVKLCERAYKKKVF